mmetsp:Transcript_8384/g.14396  ORF Transcript_8384/g.14396 Transcript_8384/m.14396 type:complete len:236 (-) Transcript_8384:1262-1969(-)
MRGLGKRVVMVNPIWVGARCKLAGWGLVSSDGDDVLRGRQGEDVLDGVQMQRRSLPVVDADNEYGLGALGLVGEDHVEDVAQERQPGDARRVDDDQEASALSYGGTPGSRGVELLRVGRRAHDQRRELDGLLAHLFVLRVLPEERADVAVVDADDAVLVASADAAIGGADKGDLQGDRGSLQWSRGQEELQVRQVAAEGVDQPGDGFRHLEDIVLGRLDGRDFVEGGLVVQRQRR